MGAGLMGEQGAESIHCHINNLMGRYDKGIKNQLKMLKYLFEMYELETSPSLQALRPVVKTRKRKRRASE